LRELGWSSAELQVYLAEEVVAHLPPQMIGFMERVSVCRRFNVELAAAVTGSEQAATLLARAEEENLLMYRVESDDRLPWYRFHPLFGEFLAARLARHGAEEVKELNRRASRWFAAHDLLVEAVRHAIAGDELEFAAEAIEQAAKHTWSLGVLSLMLNLLDRLPQPTLYAHPRLFFLGCLTLAMTARHAKAERWLAQVRESGAAKDPAISSKLPLADGAVAMQRDDTRLCMDLLEPLHEVVADSKYLQHVRLPLLAYAYAAAGRYDDAHRLLDDNPIDSAERKNDLALVAESARCLVLMTQGRVEPAARLSAQLLAAADSLHGRHSVSASVMAVGLAECWCELDRIDEARDVLANRARGVMQASMPAVMLGAALVKARLDALPAPSESVVAFLEAQAAHYQGLGLPRLVAWMQAEGVRFLLAMGQRARAADVAARLTELGTQHQNADGARAEIPALAALARARIALAGNDPHAALAALPVVREHARQYGRARMQVQEALLAALALDAQKRLDEMGARLAEAVQLAARFGLVRTLLDEGPRRRALRQRCRATRAWTRRPPPICRSCWCASATPAVRRPCQRAAATPTRRGASTPAPRELEILGLVSQAMSNKRIALTLNISLDTVKWERAQHPDQARPVQPLRRDDLGAQAGLDQVAAGIARRTPRYPRRHPMPHLRRARRP
ncbi:MAG: ATP-dependent transcriptional regulator, partial [Rubrivivax sp.]